MDSSLKHQCETLLFFLNKIIDFYIPGKNTDDKVGRFYYCCRSPTSFHKMDGRGDYDELFVQVYWHPL